MSKQAQVTISPIGAKPRRGLSSKRLREIIDAYSMLLPTILGVLIFFAVPLGISLYLSFTNSRLFGDARFVGFENYVRVFRDRNFYEALWHTFIFSVVTLIFSTAPAIFLAVLLNEKIKGQAFFRAIFFIPVVASVVGISLLWRYLFNFDFGYINYALSLVGLPRVEWLTSANWALFSAILVFCWKTIGYNMVIFLAGLQGIPAQLYEAASIDGANRWQLFSRVTLPMLSPTTFFVLVTTLINCLQVFDVPFALGWTRSNTAGPADSMLTVVILLYREGFISFRMGYASAIAWVLFLMIMVITFIQFRVSNRWVNYD
ncbi:MAG: sugar ABC transporter permease [Chloroflexaceae bacterium]|jgi:multiple sugar transport system permease protein|nr:sugar ABC transporter permease [Chloroflexaceae bacterium]